MARLPTTKPSEERVSTIEREMSTNARRPLVLLSLGALLGVLLAVLTLTGGPGQLAMPDSVVVSVNGTELKVAEYQRAIRLFASEKRSAVSRDDRLLILERMIEEELLFQHGVNRGLVRRSQTVRSKVLQSVMSSLSTELEARATDPNEPYGQRQVGDNRLAEYLGQLREAATVQWAVAAVK